jgi:hypothetical protein
LAVFLESCRAFLVEEGATALWRGAAGSALTVLCLVGQCLLAGKGRVATPAAVQRVTRIVRGIALLVTLGAFGVISLLILGHMVVLLYEARPGSAGYPLQYGERTARLIVASVACLAAVYWAFHGLNATRGEIHRPRQEQRGGSRGGRNRCSRLIEPLP